MRSLWQRMVRAWNRWRCAHGYHRFDTRGSWSRCRRQHHLPARVLTRDIPAWMLPTAASRHGKTEFKIIALDEHVERYSRPNGQCGAWRPKTTRSAGGYAWA